MRTLLFTMHCLLTLALIGCILLQRSSSGGITASNTSGPRARTSGLIRLTAVLGGVFVLNCLLLTGWVKWEIRTHQQQLQKSS